jgi:FkbM family methyltransferase
VTESGQKPRRFRRRFSPLEILLVGLFVLAVVVSLWHSAVIPTQHTLLSDERLFLVRSQEELAPFVAKYGQAHFSRYVEEWAIRDFFEDRRGGVFVDVGANHYRDDSNTYYLEQELGWSGLAIDALPEFGPDYVTHRPRTRFVAMFASDVDGSTATLFEPEHEKRIASVNQDFTARKGERGQERTVPTATLNRLLTEAGVTRIDFMSMDIELGEPKALAGFDIDRYQPALVCIEVHPEVRQFVFDYFARHGYVMEGRYFRIDPTNVYFRPLEARSGGLHGRGVP